MGKKQRGFSKICSETFCNVETKNFFVSNMSGNKTKEDEEVIYHPFQPLIHGVNYDVTSLLNQTVALFDATGTLRISHFTKIWRKMNFGLIFHGRQGFRELTEFTEDLLKIVKSYTLKHNKMGIRAAAIYLWYTLYFKQPTRPKVRLHVDKREYSDLNRFMKQCREERHWEIVYCWSKLIADHAFVFQASNKRLGLEFSGKASRTNLVSTKKPSKGFDSFFNDSEYKEVYESLQQTHTKYSAMKKALTGSSSGSGYAIYDTGLSMISEDLPDKIMKWTTTKINSSDQKNMGGNFLKENGVSIGQRRQQIIQKSYEENAIEDEADDNFETFSPMKNSGKGKGRGKNRKVSIPEIGNPDGSQTLASLAKSLAAVKEDPSLLIGLDGVPPPKKGKGRPKKDNDTKKKSPKATKVKKVKKVKKAKVENSDDEFLEF